MAEKGISVQQACRIVQIDRKSYRYKSRRKEEDQVIIDWLKQAIEAFPYYGFKKLFQQMRQQGHLYNHKKVHRLYVLLGLHLQRKPKK